MPALTSKSNRDESWTRREVAERTVKRNPGTVIRGSRDYGAAEARGWSNIDD
jgi:hypothetical protein